MKKHTGTYPLRLPASLKAAVAEISKEDGTSISKFSTAAVANDLPPILNRHRLSY